MLRNTVRQSFRDIEAAVQASMQQFLFLAPVVSDMLDSLAPLIIVPVVLDVHAQPTFHRSRGD